jgi:DNA-binding NtrC family response regulator
VRPVGGGATQPVEARIVAATHRDLQQRVREGAFREDLLHRLAVITIELPPLRERREDVPALARAILDDLGARGAEVSFSSATLEALQSCEWPGNVRELRNLIERAVTFCDDDEAPLEPEDLGLTGGQATLQYREARRRALDAFEKDFLVHLLKRHQKNVAKAAEEANIDRVYIYRMLRRHGLTLETL